MEGEPAGSAATAGGADTDSAIRMVYGPTGPPAAPATTQSETHVHGPWSSCPSPICPPVPTPWLSCGADGVGADVSSGNA